MAVKRILFTALAAIIVSFIFIYAGHFSFDKQKSGTNLPETSVSGESKAKELTAEITGVRYDHISMVLNGNRQEINLLSIDVSKPGIKVMPVLSFDLVYGFENLSAMALRKSAYAAVNGGFFDEYGLPSGMVVIDGCLITASEGRYPVFMVSGGKASLKEVKSSLWLDYGKGRLKIDRLNLPANNGEAAVYTPYYGESNRVHTGNLTVVVEKGLVTGISYSKDEAEIPDDGMLITFPGSKYVSPAALPFKTSDAVKLVHEPELPADLQAYECGNWLVKDGKSVVRDTDEWVGVMTNNDPRTAIGIKRDGTVLFFTVDGRQPGYSAGMTGRELADYLISLGAVNAAMLDGGASTEMIVKGGIVNRPSFKGQERPLAGSLVVIAVQK